MTDNKKVLDQIDDYLGGRLTGHDLDEFESVMLNDPIMQDEINIQVALRQGLSESKEELLAPTKPTLVQRINSILWNPSFSYTALALVLLGFGITWQGQTVESPVLITDVIYVDQPRSSSPTTISILKDQWFVLSIDVTSQMQDSLNLTVRDLNKVYVELESSKANAQGNLAILLPPLAVGEYQIKIAGKGQDTEYRLLVRDND